MCVLDALKADVNKPNKRHCVQDITESYCVTPSFAQTVTVEEVKLMANAFRNVNHASLFCEAIESNNYKLYEVFHTPCTQVEKT